MKLPANLARLRDALALVANSEPIVVRLPLVTRNESNQHQHWRLRAARSKAARAWAAAVVRPVFARCGAPRWVVLLERVAPRQLDDGDNLSSSLKAVRDGVADALGIDDRSDAVSWLYTQSKGSPRECAVRIHLFPQEQAA